MLRGMRDKATVGILEKLKAKGQPAPESAMGPYTESGESEVSPSGDVTSAPDSEILRELRRRRQSKQQASSVPGTSGE